MHVAYLTKDIRANHTILLSNQDVDQVALLKARTYLAFLQSKLVLKRETKKDWIKLYYGKSATFDFDLETFADPNVVAAVAYTKFVERWEQPGVAIIKPDPESMPLFFNVYLKSSANWLESNPQLLIRLEQEFDKRLVSA